MKDVNYYQKELAQLEAKHQIAQAEPETCPHVLKKQLEAIKETEAMIPDCEARLEAAKADLQEFLASHGEYDEVTSSPIYQEAKTLLVQ